MMAFLLVQVLRSHQSLSMIEAVPQVVVPLALVEAPVDMEEELDLMEHHTQAVQRPAGA